LYCLHSIVNIIQLMNEEDETLSARA